jgi:hypothetical protein
MTNVYIPSQENHRVFSSQNAIIYQTRNDHIGVRKLDIPSFSATGDSAVFLMRVFSCAAVWAQ